MIERRLTRTLRSIRPTNHSSACLRCTCSCGSIFPNRQVQQPQKRSYARPAPSTVQRRRNAGSVWLTPEEARREKRRHDLHSGWVKQQWDFYHRIGHISCTGQRANDFIRAFAQALKTAQGQNALDPTVLIELLNDHSVSFADAESLCTVLLGGDEPSDAYRGKKLLYSLSRAGYADSTIRVMAHAVLEAKKRPQVLKSREIAFSREHLTKIANEEGSGNFRAMVLEGKIALNIGNEEYAIEMFNKAMAEAVAASVRANKVYRDPLELTAPWHELMHLHLYRSQYKGKDEMAACESAMLIGCEQDDPLAHKFAADYVKRWEKDEFGDSIHVGTSDWLYHISKAAASSVPQAMHELGVFYAESGWKYIEDEPPDHIKPTPFDSYPSGRIRSTFWDALHLLGLKSLKSTPQERMFRGAIFPHTAVERLKMAIMWLNQAAELNYAPAHLMLARLYNRKTLWAQADAPPEALAMSNERYTFANKQDFLDGKPFPGQLTTIEKEDPSNPLYDVQKAQSHLVEVLSANSAHGYEIKAKKDYKSSTQAGLYPRYVDDDEALEEKNMVSRGALPPRLGKWFRYPLVRELNGEVIAGLAKEARAICEEEGWMLVDDEGGLVYKPGMVKR